MRLTVAALVIVAATLASCGGGSTEGETGETDPTPSTETTVAPTTRVASTTTEARQTTSTEAATITPEPPEEVVEGSLYGRRDTPPGGVAAQLEYYGGAEGESCGVVEEAVPYFAFALTLPPSPSYELTIGLPYAYCIEGFELDVPILLDMRGPDGLVSLWSVTVYSSYESYESDQSDPFPDLLSGGANAPTPLGSHDGGKWTPGPRAPLGNYTMEASQGTIRTTSRFTLVPSSEERVMTLSEQVSSEIGGVHRFALFGFQPGEVVPAYIYVGDYANGGWTFVTEVPPVQTDERGVAVLDLVVNPGDPPGEYCLVTASALEDLPEEVEHGFEYLADPCWVGQGGVLNGIFWIS